MVIKSLKSGNDVPNYGDCPGVQRAFPGSMAAAERGSEPGGPDSRAVKKWALAGTRPHLGKKSLQESGRNRPLASTKLLPYRHDTGSSLRTTRGG